MERRAFRAGSAGGIGMATRRLGIIMHGVTGRMGTNQHLVRSILAIRDGGRRGAADRRHASFPIRSSSAETPRSWKRLREAHGIERWTTDLAAALPIPTTSLLRCRHDTDAPRAAHARRSRPASTSIAKSRPPTTLRTRSTSRGWPKTRGVKNGVVQDKLFLPGLLKLKMLRDSGFFGRMFAVRGEFGYWVFEGDLQPTQRPSWNYREEDGGGIILDMLCHWRYVLDHVFGAVRSLTCLGATHITERFDENRKPYEGTPKTPPTRPSAGGRRRGAYQLLLADARLSRRSRHLPGRRDARLGGRRA